MSTAGGNDVGFSGIIANTIVSVSGVDLIRPFYPDMFVDENGAKERLKFLPHRLKIYDRALEAFLGVENRPSREKPVIAMLYPNLIYKSVSGGGERFCGADNTVMDVSPFLGIRNRDALKVVERLVEGKRGNGQSYDGLIETIRTSAGALGWAIVDSHRRAFREHGICAVDPAASPNESGTGTAEIPSIPYKRVDLTRSGTTAQYANPWRGYDPVTDLYPYESRKTWFRTPNQDYLNIHHYKDNMPANWTLDSNVVSARFLANRILGGSFHPTAEGHAHIADHVYCKSRAILFGEPCDPAAVNNQAHRW